MNDPVAISERSRSASNTGLGESKENRSKSCVALKCSKVLRRSVFSLSPLLVGVAVHDVLCYFEEIVYEPELQPKLHVCVESRGGIDDVNSFSLPAFADKILTSKISRTHAAHTCGQNVKLPSLFPCL